MKRASKRKKIRSNFAYSTRTKKKVLAFFVCLFFLSLGFGYAMLSSVFGINTDVAIRPSKEVRITKVDEPVLNNGAYENGNFRWSYNLLISQGVLPYENSSITYYLTITNFSSNTKTIDEIKAELNGNVDYSVDFVLHKDEILPNESVLVALTISNKSSGSTTYSAEFEFVFSDVYIDITPPTITIDPMPTGLWQKDNIDVEISATDDVSVTNMKYCITNGESCTPNVNGDFTGTTITLKQEGKFNICVMAEDSAEPSHQSVVCSNSEGNYYQIDWTAPEISVEGDEGDHIIRVPVNSNFTIPKATVKDNSGEEIVAEVSGSVDATTTGTYTLTYTAVDKAGNETVLKVSVLVYLPRLQAWAQKDTSDFHSSDYKASIRTVSFLETNDVPSDAVESWDVSEAQDGSVMAWVLNDAVEGMYQLYIGGDGSIYANKNSAFLFKDFKAVESIDIVNLITDDVTNMASMFENCTKLVNVDISHFNTSNVTSLSSIFSYCQSLVSLDFSNFDTSKVTNMSSMFAECNSLVSLDLSSFNTSKVILFNNIFNNCKNLETLNVSSFDTSRATNLTNMFNRCGKLTELDVSHFVVDNVTNFMGMFYYCSSLESLDLSNFNTAKATTMRAMFSGNTKMHTLIFGDGFVTNNVTDMNWMFAYCSALINLDVSGFDTAKVKDMSNMFQNCSNLTVIDVSGFDTSSVTNMTSMFTNCYNVLVLDVSGFDTSKVTNMNSMFTNCYNVLVLDVSGFDTSKVTNMNSMFASCSSITSLDVANFDTTNVITLENFVRSCNKLEEITLTISNSGAKTVNMLNDTKSLHKVTLNTVVDVSLYDMHSDCAPEGMNYLGWYDNAGASGTRFYVAPAGSNQTYYAVFGQAVQSIAVVPRLVESMM